MAGIKDIKDDKTNGIIAPSINLGAQIDNFINYITDIWYILHTFLSTYDTINMTLML